MERGCFSKTPLSCLHSYLELSLHHPRTDSVSAVMAHDSPPCVGKSFKAATWCTTHDHVGMPERELFLVRRECRWHVACSDKCISFSLLRTPLDSDRLIALLTAQIRWWEQIRADLMEDWQYKKLIERDALNKGGGEAGYIVWETMLELERREAPNNRQQSQCPWVYRRHLRKCNP